MSLIDGNGLSAADIAAVTGNNNNNGWGFGGDGAWLILILLLFAAFNGNGNGWGGWGGGGQMPYLMNNNTQSDVQRGFDQQAVMGGIGAIQGTLADAAIGQCNQTTTFLGTLANNKFDTITTLNNGHNAILQQMGNYEMARQQTGNGITAAIADLKYTIATEACADRAAVSQNTQMILDKLCQQEIDALKTQNANLQTQLNMANLAASQGVQTATIQAGQRALANEIEQYVLPTPRPAYVVQNPNCCQQMNYGCGCGVA